MRRPIIIGNWKMNGTIAFAKDFVSEIKKSIATNDCDIVICPPSTALYAVHGDIKDSKIMLGAQNVHFEEKGAFTGELSCSMLKECGVKYVILGHSERRKYFNESNAEIGKKVKATMQAGLIPVVCSGESLQERENGTTEKYLQAELKECFQDVKNPENCIVAYEPLWAIGTGKTPTPQEANETIAFMRGVLAEIFSKEIAEKICILYGGSVNVQNAQAFLSMPEIDGALIGGVSLIAKDFVEIINSH